MDISWLDWMDLRNKEENKTCSTREEYLVSRLEKFVYVTVHRCHPGRELQSSPILTVM